MNQCKNLVLFTLGAKYHLLLILTWQPNFIYFVIIKFPLFGTLALLQDIR